jgi:DNA-binding response OmpR family regulator
MPSSKNDLALAGLHVLLVEDSPDIGELVKTFLETEGAIVAGPAVTTREAKNLIAEHLPYVALVDSTFATTTPMA